VRQWFSRVSTNHCGKIPATVSCELI